MIWYDNQKWNARIMKKKRTFSPTPDTYVHTFYKNSEACLQRVFSNYPVVDKTEVMII